MWGNTDKMGHCLFYNADGEVYVTVIVENVWYREQTSKQAKKKEKRRSKPVEGGIYTA